MSSILWQCSVPLHDSNRIQYIENCQLSWQNIAMSHDVFISFAFKDQEAANSIRTYLEKNNLKCFMCTDLPGGTDFAIKLGEAISQSQLLLLVFSTSADDSESVRSEVNIAKMHNKTRIPVRIEDRMPNKLAYLIGTALFFDAFPAPVETHLPRLVLDIRRHLGIASKMSLREELNIILQPREYTPGKLVEYFKRDLGKQFTASAGVWQGHTVEQHTVMVLTQFEKYFSLTMLPSNFDKNTFRVILALHDIGVADAIEDGTRRGMNLREAKKWGQHRYTRQLMEPALRRLEFSKKEIEVALALISGDPIGQYLKDGGGQKTCEIIKRMADEAGMKVLDFFELLLVFYMVDAGSYTQDAGGPKALDRLFKFDHKNKRMSFARETADKIKQLRIYLSSKPGCMFVSDHNWHDIDYKYLRKWVKTPQNKAKLDRGEVLKGTIIRYKLRSKGKYQIRLTTNMKEALYVPDDDC